MRDNKMILQAALVAVLLNVVTGMLEQCVSQIEPKCQGRCYKNESPKFAQMQLVCLADPTAQKDYVQSQYALCSAASQNSCNKALPAEVKQITSVGSINTASFAAMLQSLPAKDRGELSRFRAAHNCAETCRRVEFLRCQNSNKCKRSKTSVQLHSGCAQLARSRAKRMAFQPQNLEQCARNVLVQQNGAFVQPLSSIDSSPSVFQSSVPSSNRQFFTNNVAASNVVQGPPVEQRAFAPASSQNTANALNSLQPAPAPFQPVATNAAPAVTGNSEMDAIEQCLIGKARGCADRCDDKITVMEPFERDTILAQCLYPEIPDLNAKTHLYVNCMKDAGYSDCSRLSRVEIESFYSLGRLATAKAKTAVLSIYRQTKRKPELANLNAAHNCSGNCMFTEAMKCLRNLKCTAKKDATRNKAHKACAARAEQQYPNPFLFLAQCAYGILN